MEEKTLNHYIELALDGSSDADCEVDGIGHVHFFVVLPSDRAEFPELTELYAIALTENEAGEYSVIEYQTEQDYQSALEEAFGAALVHEAYGDGFRRGYDIASWIDLPEIGKRVWLEVDGHVTVDADNQWDIVQTLAYEAEANSRQYSPFEELAKTYNEAPNSETVWEAFEEGIQDGIARNIELRRKAYAK